MKKVSPFLKYLFKLFFSFEGRITVNVFMFSIWTLLFFTLFLVDYFPSKLFELPKYIISNQDIQKIIKKVIFYAILSWPILALSYKRRHDFEKSGKPIAYLYFLVFIMIGLMSFLIEITKKIPTEGLPGFLASITVISSAIITTLYFLIAPYVLLQMVWKKGTKGPNKYGPDPLAKETKKEETS